MVTDSWQQIRSVIERLNQMKNNPESVSEMITVSNSLNSLLLRYSVEKNSGANINTSRRVSVVMPSVFSEGNITTIKSQEHAVMEEEVEELGAAKDYGTQSNIEENVSLEDATVEAPIQESISKIQEMEIIPEQTKEEEKVVESVIAPEIVEETAEGTNTNVEEEKEETPINEPIEEETPAITNIETEPQSTPEVNESIVSKPNKQYSIWEAYSSNEIPTLAQQQPTQHKTVNEQVVETGDDRSYNNSSSSPIKDLKKAISISDRYLFINELFRGEESTYERSIKTINSFNVYQEARYWIDRELKVKLGWDDKNPTVKQFDALVQRRFS